MALTPWTGRTAAQTDSDSPADQPLMDSIRKDLDHLREFCYGNGAGGFLTPIEGHDHDTLNSAAIQAVAAGAIDTAELANNAVTNAKLAASAVKQANLDRTGQTQSNSTTTWQSFTLTGGSYCFFPQSYASNVNGVECYMSHSSGVNTSTSPIAHASMRAAAAATTGYVIQWYIDASGKEHWLFCIVDKMTGLVMLASETANHPSWGNGNNPDKIIHPFMNYWNNPLPPNHEIVLLDMDSIKELQRLKGSKQSILELLHDDNGEPDFIINTAKTLTFAPRDMNGKDTLKLKHDSYVVRELKPRPVII